MFSGKDAANPSYPTQWALNPVAYQNVDTSQVDWAALAQQWIAMKEAAAIVGAPPTSSKVEAEEGEAPMEVENPDQNSEPSMPPGAEWNSTTNSWGTPAWNQWGWGWSGPGPVDSKIPPDPAMAMPPLIDGYPIPDGPTMPGYTTGPMTTPTFQHGYWTAPQADAPENRDNGDRNRDTRRSKSRNREIKPNRPRPPREKIPVMPPVIEPIVMPPSMITPTIDAAKRRQLPAWIREGLEKMEREKQKAIEREQEKKALEEAEKEKKRLEEAELARLKAEASGVPMLPAKSKFDSDSEGEAASAKEGKVVQGSSREGAAELSIKEETEDKPPPTRSREEIMQEVMLAVRRSLTEILLEVTDHEIHLVSQEELARFNFHQASHLNAMKASKSKALASITSGLGLGAYESSSDDSDAEDNPNDISDHQLMEVIRRRRAEFERTARDIEAEVRRADSELAAPPAPATPDRSSSTPPPPAVDGETPEKKPERRPSKDKKSNHKSNERGDGTRKENSEDKRDSKKSSSKYDRTPSPPNTPDRVVKDNSNDSSSDSEEDSDSSSTDKSSSESDAKGKHDKSKRRKRKSSSSTSSPKKSKSKKQTKKMYKHDDKNSYSKSKRHDDYGKTEKSKSRRKDDYGYDKRKSSRSRDYDRSHRDKYREGSEDDRPKKRSRRSRSVSYESRSGRRRSRDRTYGRDSSKRDRSHDRRDGDRNDKYARVRDDRRRSRSTSRSRHRR